MIHGFFFDLDGTLVDTHQANYEAYRRAILEVSGVEITFEQFKTTVGHVATTFLPWFVPNADPEVYARIATLKATYYKGFMHLTRLNTALVSFMDLMKDSQLVLVTTAKRKNAEAVLAHHGLTDLFDHIVTAENVAQSKPAPDAYLRALQLVSLQPAEVIVFEDSDAGRQAAEAAGLSVVMVNNFSL